MAAGGVGGRGAPTVNYPGHMEMRPNHELEKDGQGALPVARAGVAEVGPRPAPPHRPPGVDDLHHAPPPTSGGTDGRSTEKGRSRHRQWLGGGPAGARGDKSSRGGRRGSESPGKLLEDKVITDLVEGRERYCPGDPRPKVGVDVAETAEDVEDKCALRNRLSEVTKGIRHPLHAVPVLRDGKIPLDEGAEGGVQLDSTGLAVAKELPLDRNPGLTSSVAKLLHDPGGHSTKQEGPPARAPEQRQRRSWRWRGRRQGPTRNDQNRARSDLGAAAIGGGTVGKEGPTAAAPSPAIRGSTRKEEGAPVVSRGGARKRVGAPMAASPPNGEERVLAAAASPPAAEQSGGTVGKGEEEAVGVLSATSSPRRGKEGGEGGHRRREGEDATHSRASRSRSGGTSAESDGSGAGSGHTSDPRVILAMGRERGEEEG
ncbi:hypothetical protein GUJ93_ZPchr0004g38377 [Zizania palustris]|uniref:Uncharacterized protein n=1 Tax=Zizania palustris TaxID=103762 RepID=A0A8J5V903_ZIZPA|nr:hypothetical protein GUJ93_ZPchr0004g38377 [Zizania palustris]